MSRKTALVVALLGLLSQGLLLQGVLLGQQIHRNPFESTKPAWVKSGFDAPFEETAHEISDKVWHDGQRSEHIQIQCKVGNFVHYQYSVGRVPIGEETSGSLWLKANRPGVQLLARLVLPNERDPQNLDNRLTTYIRGDEYRNAGRWQRLELGRVVQLVKNQQQLMAAQLNRAVNFTDAYIDALVLNLYAGPGPTDAFIDDLEVGPTFTEAIPSQPTLPVAKPGARPGSRNLAVEFAGNQLTVGGKRLFFHAIRQTDVPLRPLRDAGFNAVFVDPSVSPNMLQEAVDMGFWVIPQLKLLSDDSRMGTTDEITKDMNRYTENDAVLFWHLGGTLSFEQSVPMSRAVQVVRQQDPGRPMTADVWDGLMPYSHMFKMVGVHRWPLMTTLELPQYREWLEQRRRLANPGSFTWTWIQTHMPEWYTNILYDRAAAATFTEPIGPQPEQIRLLAYTAIASGAKGLGFWSDRFLADSHQGRDRLLACAVLNQELDMLEPMLVSAEETPQWIDTSVPDVKAAILRTAKGLLVLPIWQGRGAQFVPGQAAVSKLTLVVPQVPQSAQAWEVTPADVRSLRSERVPGGTKIVVPEFGLTSAIVFTSDTNVVVRFQEQARNRRKDTSQYTYDMALYEMHKVLKIQDELEKLGHTLPDAQHLINDGQSRLKTALERWKNHDFAESYRESERALRPIRILMRAQWEQALKGLDTPVASPYAVTFFTLPRHYKFMDEIKRSVTTANVVSGGDFEIIPDRTQDSWKLEEQKLDDVEFVADRVSELKPPPGAKWDPGEGGSMPKQGKQCAMLQIKPKKGPTPFALERALLSLTSPAVKLTPGSLVKVSGWIRIPQPIVASPDGALFYDSAGGEPLAVRLTDATQWRQFTLYRRVPASGTMTVTLALTGIGTVYFDDVRIEPLVPAGAGATAQR